MRTKAKPAGTSGGQRFLATDWKPYEDLTLRGFFSIVTPHGFKINDVMLHEYRGMRWIRLPGEPYLRPDGSARYIELIQFENHAARQRFDEAALNAVDELRKVARPTCP